MSPGLLPHPRRRLTPDNPTDVRSVAAPRVGSFDRPELVEIFSELANR
ncbi:hypothetical protein [Plantactinospora sp. CA-290183]